jgi:hypothetical protein
MQGGRLPVQQDPGSRRWARPWRCIATSRTTWTSTELAMTSVNFSRNSVHLSGERRGSWT